MISLPSIRSVTGWPPTEETGTDTDAVVVVGVCPRFWNLADEPETRTDTGNTNSPGVSPRFRTPYFLDSG